MSRLNTTKLMKQCKKMAAEQAASAIKAAQELDINIQAVSQVGIASDEIEFVQTPAPVQLPDIEEELEITPMDLAEYLADFLEICRDAKSDYQKAVDAEQEPSSAIQDILHAAEFAPSALDKIDILETLHNLRTVRREAKKNLEITDLFQQWAERNQKATRELSETVGAMRKIIRRQPNDFYRWKTDVLGEKGTPMIKDE